jgi:hypothetical protein
MSRKISKRERLVCELASIRTVQSEKPSWFRREDYDRLAREWSAKSAELVELLVSARVKRNKRIMARFSK